MSVIKVNRKDKSLMQQTTSNITGTLIDLRAQLEALDAIIKADEKSKAEFEIHLSVLYKQRDELNKTIHDNNEWAKSYETDLGPFTKKYGEITSDIESLYVNAKKGHAKGLKLLEKEFQYHPAFKRPGDTFTGIPFKPK